MSGKLKIFVNPDEWLRSRRGAKSAMERLTELRKRGPHSLAMVLILLGFLSLCVFGVIGMLSALVPESDPRRTEFIGVTVASAISSVACISLGALIFWPFSAEIDLLVEEIQKSGGNPWMNMTEFEEKERAE